MVVPNGVCNGFQTVSTTSQSLYCFDAEWQPGMTSVMVNPVDPLLGIDWPLPPVLSGKDALPAAPEKGVCRYARHLVRLGCR